MKKLRYPIAMLSLFGAFLMLTSCHKDQAEPRCKTGIIGKWTWMPPLQTIPITV
ncbi:MAG: hypothetical protein WDO19_22325 [Bacteroidota bacterium]